MPYTTQIDLEDAAGGAARFVELADFDGDGVADAAMVARAQAAADGFVDAHLRKFSAADLERLRASPSDTIRRLAADETIFRLREHRRQIGDDDRESQKLRKAELEAMRADKLRPDDQKQPRARWVENDDPVSRKNTRGMW